VLLKEVLVFIAYCLTAAVIFFTFPILFFLKSVAVLVGFIFIRR
jgi:hypothetical protein